MNKLLKGRRVFIDTTEFSNAHFDMESPAFKSFTDLCNKGRFRLFTTEITKAEIEKGIQHQTKELCNLIKQAGGYVGIMDKPELKKLQALNKNIDQMVLSAKVGKQVQQFFSSCQAVVLPIPETATAHVLSDFLNQKPPFDTAKKKSEFPDAFVIHAICQAAQRSHGAFYVISDDDDFKRACANQIDVVHLRQLSQLLNLAQMDLATTSQIQRTLKRNLSVIESWSETLFQNMNVTADYPGVSVSKSTVKLDDILDFLVISCEGQRAVADVVCLVQIDAICDQAIPPEFVVAVDSFTDMQTVSITFEFDFDPQDASIFDVKFTWAPTNLHI